MYADLGHYHCRHRSYGRISAYYALYIRAVKCVSTASGALMQQIWQSFCILLHLLLLPHSTIPFCSGRTGFLFYINKMLTKYILSDIKVILYVFFEKV